MSQFIGSKVRVKPLRTLISQRIGRPVSDSEFKILREQSQFSAIRKFTKFSNPSETIYTVKEGAGGPVITNNDGASLVISTNDVMVVEAGKSPVAQPVRSYAQDLKAQPFQPKAPAAPAKESVMSKIKDTATETANTFKEAGVVTLKIEGGKTLTEQAKRAIGAILPENAKPFLDHKFADIFIAGGVNLLAKSGLIENDKLDVAADAMVLAAVTKVGSDIGAPKMINDLIDDLLKGAPALAKLAEKPKA